MRRLLLTLVALFAVAATSAQCWSAGLRLGSGAQLVAQYNYNYRGYLEGRVGVSWLAIGGINGDASLLHNWHISEMCWTPNAGDWFFDAGVGANVNGHRGQLSCGVVGVARLGIKLHDLPLTISLDYSPIFGPTIYRYTYYDAALLQHSALCSEFNFFGLYNAAITLSFRF